MHQLFLTIKTKNKQNPTTTNKKGKKTKQKQKKQKQKYYQAKLKVQFPISQIGVFIQMMHHLPSTGGGSRRGVTPKIFSGGCPPP